MLTTLATTFMTTTRMDGFAQAANGTALPRHRRPRSRGFAARALAGLRRLVG